MTVEELERFNRGNELKSQIDSLTHKKNVITGNTYELSITIEESFGDVNKHKSWIKSTDYDSELISQSLVLMLENMIESLQNEFDTC